MVTQPAEPPQPRFSDHATLQMTEVAPLQVSPAQLADVLDMLLIVRCNYWIISFYSHEVELEIHWSSLALATAWPRLLTPSLL